MDSYIKRYRLKFVAYLESLGFTYDEAVVQLNAHIESVGPDELGHPIEDADECLSYYGD